VVLISEDLDELFEMSDRLLVMHAGRIIGEFVDGSYDRELVGALMSGGSGRGSDADV
jgi:simple sugar transport system ATP-binding protein